MDTVSKTETCAINDITVGLKSKSVILKAIYLKLFSDMVSSPPANNIPIYITCKTASAVHVGKIPSWDWVLLHTLMPTVILKELLLHAILAKSVFLRL